MTDQESLPQVMLVYVRHWQRRMPWGGAIKNPRLEVVAGRTFIIGESISRSRSSDGRKIAFAWDEILSWYEFASEEAYHSACPERRRSGLRRFFG